jgi:hypothetical protein
MHQDAQQTSGTADPSTRNLFLWVFGFGTGVLVTLFLFVFLVGIGELGNNPAGIRTPASQSAASAPIEPGRPPHPAPQTGGMGAQTMGQAPPPQPAPQRVPDPSSGQPPAGH